MNRIIKRCARRVTTRRRRKRMEVLDVDVRKAATRGLIMACRQLIATASVLRADADRMEDALEKFLIVCGDPDAPEPQGVLEVKPG